MKQFWKNMRKWFKESQQRMEDRHLQSLRDEASRLIVMRKVCMGDAEHGWEGYAIFVGGNIVETSPDLNQQFCDKMFKLREIYYDLWKPQSAYKLL